MNTPNDSAFPTTTGEIFYSEDGIPTMPLTPGLSKRELFAALAMQGMVAGSQGLDITHAQFATGSVNLADALLSALESKKERSRD